MASTLPSTTDCCDPCSGEVVVQTPGPAGDDGSDGAAGTNGVNAFTTTTDGFTMPAEGADVTVDVADSTWMTATQKVYVSGAGYMEVRSKPNATSVVLRNIEDTAAGEYTENVAPSTVIATSQTVSPAGIQGPAGEDGSSGAPEGASYWTRTAEGGLSGETALDALSDGVVQHVSGTPSIADLLTAIEALSNNGLIVRAGASAATNRSIVGTANQISVADGDGVAGDPTLSLHAGVYRAGGTDVAVADGGTGASSAGGARTNLGLLRGTGGYLLFRHEEATTTDGGAFTSGSWVKVPLNTETVDSDGNGSIASSQITLDAGTYRYRFGVWGYQVDNFQGRLYNATDLAVIFNSYGSTARSRSTDDGVAIAHGEGRFTIASSKAIELQAQCDTTKNTDGFGLANSFGGTEVYSWIELWKEAGA